LGLGTTEDHVTVPKEIVSLRGKEITSMACGEDFSVVVATKDLYTFGRGGMGQHGTDLWGGNLFNISSPHKIVGLTDRINRISCGWGHIVAVAKRRVWSWGADGHGQCGSMDSPASISPLLMMAFPEEQPLIIEASCGGV